jgi:uncharacterized SAM-binding protein YcdF (DUF218 family)
MDTAEVNNLAQIIWDYHHLHQPLKTADAILVLCSNDTRVAEYAADLFLRGYAPYLIFSGGLGDLTKNIFKKPEAEVFADVALEKGVPLEKMILENKSTNTGENVQFTRQLLRARGLNFSSLLVVQKPYMERRTYATFKKNWPGQKFIVTSPPLDLEHYPNDRISQTDLINIMVGDLQRLKIYPARGFQIPQEIPASVWAAYEKLVSQGFNQRLIKD